MVPDRMHPKVLRELMDFIATSFSIILERSGGVAEDWKKANVASTFKMARST